MYVQPGKYRETEVEVVNVRDDQNMNQSFVRERAKKGHIFEMLGRSDAVDYSACRLTTGTKGDRPPPNYSYLLSRQED